MAEADLERLEWAFHRARELTGPARESFLAELVREDPQLVPDLRKLLALDAQESGVVERLQGEILDEWVGDRAPEGLVGRRVGGYRITGLLGRGGMGAVYRAERAEAPFQQEVALKLLAMGVDSPMARMRFDQERQILAHLKHPGIASILDGGVAEDGTPWFALELVEGIPLDRFAREKALSRRARIELFLQVCRAVEHAHGRLVLHRDLKPGNTLVTADGQVKLLDFGVGRFLEDSAMAPEATITRLGSSFTPGYSPPEQLRGEAAEVSSDIYSLGALLHTLLTGAPPPAPGRVSLESGELKWIILHAVDPEPERRYAVVQELRADLERHLAGRAVLAHPPSRLYRFRRFVGRHRAAAAVTVALLVGGVGSGIGFVRAVQAETRAREEAALAQAVSSFLEGLFRLAVDDPETARVASAAQVLARGVEEAEVSLSQDPAVQARVLSSLGLAYSGLGRQEEADSTLRRAVEVADRADPPDPVAAASARTRLAILATRQGQPARADTLARAAVALVSGLADREWEVRADAHAALGSVHQFQGRLDSARIAFRTAREVALTGTDGVYVPPRLLLALGFLQFTEGDVDGAEATYREAVRFAGDSLPMSTSQYGWALDGLATVLFRDTRSDRRDEALEIREEALQLLESRLGPRHPRLVGALNNAGAAAHYVEDWDQAEAHYRRALELAREVDASRLELSRIQGNLALTLSRQGRMSQAVAQLREAMATLPEAAPGAERQLLASHYTDLGAFLRETDPATASAALDSATLLLERESGPAAPGLTEVRFFRARLAVDLEEWETALAQARMGRQGVAAVDRGRLPSFDLVLAEAFLGAGQVDSAQVYLARAEDGPEQTEWREEWLRVAAAVAEARGEEEVARARRDEAAALAGAPGGGGAGPDRQDTRQGGGR